MWGVRSISAPLETGVDGSQRLAGLSLGYDRYVGPWTFGAIANLDLALTEIGRESEASATALYKTSMLMLAKIFYGLVMLWIAWFVISFYLGMYSPFLG